MRVARIIFDGAGVLVDREPIVNRGLVEMLGEFGSILDDDVTLREFSGGAMRTRRETSQQQLGWSRLWASFVTSMMASIGEHGTLSREVLPSSDRRAFQPCILPEEGAWPIPCLVSSGGERDVRSAGTLSALAGLDRASQLCLGPIGLPSCGTRDGCR